MAERLGGEVEAAAGLSDGELMCVDGLGGGNGWEGFYAPSQPEETFCGDVLLLLELVDDEVLQGLGERGCGELAVTDFLFLVSISVSKTKLSNYSSSCSWRGTGQRTLMFPLMSPFTGLKAAPPSTSVPMSAFHLPPMDRRFHSPKSDSKLSDASRNSVVEILLSAEIGTSTKLFLRVSKKVDMLVVPVCEGKELGKRNRGQVCSGSSVKR